MLSPPRALEYTAPTQPAPAAPVRFSQRPRASGKFLWAGGQKLFVRGVTYGPFGGSGEEEYGGRPRVEQDFARIAASGLNAIRTYSVPPPWLLDAAERHG